MLFGTAAIIENVHYGSKNSGKLAVNVVKPKH